MSSVSFAEGQLKCLGGTFKYIIYTHECSVKHKVILTFVICRFAASVSVTTILPGLPESKAVSSGDVSQISSPSKEGNIIFDNLHTQ